MEPDNNPLEQRLAQHLGATAQGIEPPPGSPSNSIHIAHRRQRNRRTFGSSLAAIALIATGIGAYQLSDSDGTVDIAADVDDGSTVEEPTDDQTATEGSTAGSTDPLSLPVSTGPVLDWTEVDAPDGWFGGTVIWTGDAFIALTHGESGSTLTRSEDGTQWTDGNVPEGYEVWGLQGSGQSLVAWGSEPFVFEEGDRTDPFNAPETTVFVSSDGGISWKTLPAVPAAADIDNSSPYLFSSGSVGGAAVVGDTVVVGVSQHLQFDIPKIAEDFGIETDGENAEFRGWSTSEDKIGICLDDFCNEEFTISYDELGLSPEESEAMFRGNGSTEVYRSVDGGEWERGDLSTTGGYTDAILAVGNEFKMCVMGEEQGSSLYSSPDGLAWTLVSSNNEMGGLTTDGTNLYAQSWTMDGGLVRSTDGGVTWEPILTGVQNAHSVQAGPSGITASGQLYDDSSYGGPEFPVSIEKDGYIITWLEAGLTVANAETGEVILSFDEEDMDAEEAPETVIEEESEDSFGLTFLDPETLEPLVSLDQDDFDEAFNIDTSFDDESYEEPEFFLGWSGDGGQTWGWQTSTEAFGINGWTQFAVGDGIVVAMVEEIMGFPAEAEPAPDATDEGTTATTVGPDQGDMVAPSSRVFVATLD